MGKTSRTKENRKWCDGLNVDVLYKADKRAAKLQSEVRDEVKALDK